MLGSPRLRSRQHPVASVTSRPVPSVSRLVGTTTRVADVKPVVPTKSSPPKKDTQSSKPSSPIASPAPEADAYFTVKTYKGKSKESSPITNVQISPIKFKESIWLQIFYLRQRSHLVVPK